MRIRALSTPELGNRSYVVDDGAVSVVIDPQRDLDRLDALLEHDVSHVLETHVHNDYVSGGRELARRAGAAYGVNAADEVAFERLPLDDGQQLLAGSLSICVLATPGHTPTHLSYVVRDLADPLAPPAVFSGGSLLYGTVGRTDLISPDLTRELAAAQHVSAHRLGALPGDAALYPTHGFGSFCAGGATSGADASTIAGERRHNHALTTTSSVEFVDLLVASFSAYPSYYAHMGALNRAAEVGVDLATPVALTPPQQVAALVSAGATVIDLRPAEEFAADHLAGTVSINLGAQFATYVGWLAPWGRPLVVIGEHPDQLADARRQLTRIGVDDVRAAWGPLDALSSTPTERRSYRRVSFAELAAERTPSDVVLDVRRTDEHADGRVVGAVNIPIHELESRATEVQAAAESAHISADSTPPDPSSRRTYAPTRPSDGARTRVWVHCAGGFRAGTATSILDGRGYEVIHVDDGFDHAVELGLTEA